MLHKVWDKKGNLKIAETPKMIGKVETGTINRERRKTMTVVLEVEVKTQHNSHKPSTNKPIKNDKKEWPTLAEASKVERRKKRPFFCKMRPYKQRREERFETVEIKNYDESETNNSDQQSEYKNCTRYARCSEPNRRKWEQFRKR